ncbi:lytic transglycosylase domain-containing protein [Candidatus Margulisiibacteriota bacterium]
MEGIIILALAVFLLTSAGERDTRTTKAPIAADPKTQSVRPVFKYQKPDGYQQIDGWRLRSFIKRFKTEYPDHQVETLANTIIKHSKIYDIDPKLMAALIARESSFDIRAKSSTGALGLGQIKPFNFSWLGISNPYDPEQNIKGVAIMMRDLLNKWEGHTLQIELSLASYKEGYNAVKKRKTYNNDTKIYIEDIKEYRKNLN